jgi:ribosomal protein S17E
MQKVSRGLRNNNPGNIRNSKTVWQGEIIPSKDNSFKQFKSMAYGYRALIKLLQNYRKLYDLKTVAELINRWAPSNENNTAGYITRVCKEMQVPSTHVPDINDKATMCAMAAAISQVENGVPAVMEDVRKGWELL